MRLQGVEPGAFAGHGTTHNPEALALPFDWLGMLSEPLPNGLAAVPRRMIPHPQQGGFAPGGHLGADPGPEDDRHRTPRPFGHEAQPPVRLAHALGRPLLDQPALTGQGCGVRIGGRHGLLDAPQGLLRRSPGLQRGRRQATSTTSHLHSPAPTPGGLRPSGSGGLPGFFLRADAGAGLVSQRVARCQFTSTRRRAVRIAARLTRWGVRPWAKLTSAATSHVHRLLGWPKVRGL